VHGDYRLDNVLMGDDDRIKAILDWEMSTLGDPLTDLGLLVMYSMPLGLPHSPVSTTAEAAGHPTVECYHAAVAAYRQVDPFAAGHTAASAAVRIVLETRQAALIRFIE
jgi:aminoglycoside phosphotransferase (APT) family kinase protein